MKISSKQLRGFTLIELLAVVTIIVLLIAMLLPTLKRVMYSARLAACASNLHQIVGGLNAFALDHDRYYPGHPADTSVEVRTSTYLQFPPYSGDADRFAPLAAYYSVHKANNYNDLSPNVNPMWRCPEGYNIDPTAQSYYALYCNTIAGVPGSDWAIPGSTYKHRKTKNPQHMLEKIGGTMYMSPSKPGWYPGTVQPGNYSILASDYCNRSGSNPAYLMTNHLAGDNNYVDVSNAHSDLNYATTSGHGAINYAFTDGRVKRYAVTYDLIMQKMYLASSNGITIESFIFPKAWEQQ